MASDKGSNKDPLQIQAIQDRRATAAMCRAARHVCGLLLVGNLTEEERVRLLLCAGSHLTNLVARSLSYGGVETPERR